VKRPRIKRPQGCRFLLGSLIALLVAFPFLEDLTHTRPLILMLLLAGVFVAGVVAVDAGSLQVRRAFAIAAVQVVATLISLVLPEAGLAYLCAIILTLVATAFLILFATHCVLHYVLRARVITPDQIYAGICMYLMLGFAFGAIFYLTNTLDPNSFAVNSGKVAPGDVPDLMYFSFVTLATLGYGDITPSTNIARSLAVLEALAGMLYIAVFMARLVSLSSTSQENERSARDG